jgi:hypothetical protein
VTEPNDGRFPDESDVLVRYPAYGMTADHARDSWPWMPGVVENQCGPDEWLVTVYAEGLAMLEDGTPAPEGTAGIDKYFPQCFRSAEEIRLASEDGSRD